MKLQHLGFSYGLKNTALQALSENWLKIIKNHVRRKIFYFSWAEFKQQLDPKLIINGNHFRYRTVKN